MNPTIPRHPDTQQQTKGGTMKNETQTLKDFHDGTTYKLWRTCACGCNQVVPNVWAQGHDMRKKSMETVKAPKAKKASKAK